MNLEFDLFRQSLMTQVLNCQNTVGIPIYLPGSPGIEPATGVWAYFTFGTGKTGRAELGGGAAGLQRTTGIMQFTLLTPDKSGDGPLWRYANLIKRQFDEVSIQVPPSGYWTTETFNIQPMGGHAVKKGFLCLVVDGPVDFWHRNVDALTT